MVRQFVKKYILIQELQVINANAMSSTITVGVPAMTAWLGAVHALERKVRQMDTLKNIRFPRMAVSYLTTNLQVYRKRNSRVTSIIGTANPLDKDGSKASFIEEPRIHLSVSLLIEMLGVTGDMEDQLCCTIGCELDKMKIAGGDVLSFQDVKVLYSSGTVLNSRKIINQLMPGFVLINRNDLLVGNDVQNDVLNRLIDYIAIHNHVSVDNGNHVCIKTKKEPGWIIPIAVGFKGISELGKVANQRDDTKLHCFVEPVIALGEFRMAYRFTSINRIMWEYKYISDENLYLCVN